MGFNVKYDLIAGSLNSNAIYQWVIEPPQGPAWRNRVDLAQRGDLTAFVPQWPPTSGTYTTYIEEVRPGNNGSQVVSKRLKLTYAY